MKAEDLRTKTADELNGLLMEARKAQMNMRFQRSQGALEKTDDIRKTRRDIARIKTVQNAQRKALTAAVAKNKPAGTAAGKAKAGAAKSKKPVEAAASE